MDNSNKGYSNDSSDEDYIQHIRTLKAKGLPRPADVPEELWDEVTPAAGASAYSMVDKLRKRNAQAAAQDLPTDELATVRAFFGSALDSMVDVMLTASKDSDRAAAAKTIIEYTLGKPEQRVTHSGNLALEVNQQLNQLAKGLQEGSIIDVQNLLAKPKLGVDNFLEANMPEKFIVGRKVSSEGRQPRQGVPEGTGGEDEA